MTDIDGVTLAVLAGVFLAWVKELDGKLPDPVTDGMFLVAVLAFFACVIGALVAVIG